LKKRKEKQRKKNAIETHKMKLVLNEMHWGESCIEEEKIERTLEMREDVNTCELVREEMFERSANEAHHLLVLTLKDCIIGWPS